MESSIPMAKQVIQDGPIARTLDAESAGRLSRTSHSLRVAWRHWKRNSTEPAQSSELGPQDNQRISGKPSKHSTCN